jgi:hypothetical protein
MMHAHPLSPMLFTGRPTLEFRCLQSLDLSQLDSLESLAIKCDSLDQLNLAGCPKLKEVELQCNHLQSLHLCGTPLVTLPPLPSECQVYAGIGIQ